MQDAIDVLEKVKDNYVSTDVALKSIRKQDCNGTNGIEAVIDALSAESDNVKGRLEAKDSSLQSFVTVVCVISCVALGDSGAFVAWFFLDRKRNTNKLTSELSSIKIDDKAYFQTNCIAQ